MRVILFDIDGTLILTGGAGLLGLRRVFRELYDVEDASEGIAFHGLTDPIIVQSIGERHLGRRFDRDEFERIVERYYEALEEALAEVEDYEVLPGVHRLLDHLGDRDDVILGLATGNFEPAAWKKLRRGELHRHFDFGGFGTDSSDRAELTRRAHDEGRRRAGGDVPVIVVGDTIHDVRAAKACGADCLGVATGNASEETLAAEGARWTVPNLEAPEVAEILTLEAV